jgi:hypothetical protein
MAAVSAAKAQGDSDPGLAQIGAMRTASAIVVTEEEYENQRPQFSLGHTFSHGEKDVKYNIPELQLRIPLIMQDINKTGYFDVKLPLQNSAGDLGSKWGVGDLTVAYTHMFMADPTTWTIQGTAGILFGMTHANVTDAATRPLPMSYQPGLGSTDGMVGFNLTFKEYLTVAAGYQQAILRYNDNDYHRSSPLNDPIYSNSDYTVGRHLYRYGDAMLRVEGHFITNRAGVTAGALGLYHVHDDLYEDAYLGWQNVKDSHGLTLSLVGNAFVRFGRYGACKLDVTGSVPVYTRTVRPDGLERWYTLTPRFTFFFNQRKLLF